jgi:hypothetical protein
VVVVVLALLVLALLVLALLVLALLGGCWASYCFSWQQRRD